MTDSVFSGDKQVQKNHQDEILKPVSWPNNNDPSVGPFLIELGRDIQLYRVSKKLESKQIPIFHSKALIFFVESNDIQSQNNTPKGNYKIISEERKIFSKTPKKSKFELIVIGVDSIDRTNPRGQTKLEERMLHSRGLGAQRVTFFTAIHLQ